MCDDPSYEVSAATFHHRSSVAALSAGWVDLLVWFGGVENGSRSVGSYVRNGRSANTTFPVLPALLPITDTSAGLAAPGKLKRG